MSAKSGKPDLTGYNYGAISSLVLMADRSVLPRRDKEPDGVPTSLAGRIDPKEMDSRAIRQAPKDLNKKKEKASDKQEPFNRQKSNLQSVKLRSETTTQHVEGLTYHLEPPKHVPLFLSLVHTALGDQAQDIVRTSKVTP
jgi:pre-mRNA-splicing helicase BRR2